MIKITRWNKDRFYKTDSSLSNNLKSLKTIFKFRIPTLFFDSNVILALSRGPWDGTGRPRTAFPWSHGSQIGLVSDIVWVWTRFALNQKLDGA